MFCTRCGQTNADEARFCQRCGTPFAATTNRLAEPPITFASPPGTEAAPTGAVDSAMQETDPKAIISLISSLVFFLFPLSQIAAIVLGHLSRADIQRSGGRKKGEGMALAGLIIGYVQVALLPVALIVAAIAIPNLLRARTLANESAAIQNVRRIVTAENTIHGEKSVYTCNSEDFSDTELRELLDNGPKHGYRFALSACSADEFRVLATPAVYNSTGTRMFCADQTGDVKSVQALITGGDGAAKLCVQQGNKVR
jgi:Domain of unknown function (DUF4190)/zinc-ribbon domain